MLTQRQLTDRATICQPSEGSRDGFGNPTVTWDFAHATVEPALYQQQNSAEQIENRDTTVSRGILFGITGSVITAASRVQLASQPGKTFRVVGDPSLLAAIGGRSDHTEAVLELITG